MERFERIEAVMEEELSLCEEYLRLSQRSLDMARDGSFPTVEDLLREKDACIERLSFLEEELRSFEEDWKAESDKMRGASASRIVSLSEAVAKKMKDILRIESEVMEHIAREKERVSHELVNLNRSSSAAMSYTGDSSANPRFLNTWR